MVGTRLHGILTENLDSCFLYRLTVIFPSLSRIRLTTYRSEPDPLVLVLLIFLTQTAMHYDIVYCPLFRRIDNIQPYENPSHLNRIPITGILLPKYTFKLQCSIFATNFRNSYQFLIFSNRNYRVKYNHSHQYVKINQNSTEKPEDFGGLKKGKMPILLDNSK